MEVGVEAGGEGGRLMCLPLILVEAVMLILGSLREFALKSKGEH